MNPFTVLNVDKDVAQKDIIRAVAVAMREKKYSAAEIAVAQKTLLDPISRGCEEFLHYIDLSGYKNKLCLEIAENLENLENIENAKDAEKAAGSTGSHGDGVSDASGIQYLDLFL